MSARVALWLLAAGVLGCGAASVWLGQDLNFDLLNYHYYVGYAFLHDRWREDVVPAGIQTYHSPLLHALHYLGFAHLPPRLFGFTLGLLHGLNLPALFVLGRTVLASLEPGRRTVVALAAALLGAAGPAAVSMLGTTFGDNLVTLPALVALALALGELRRAGAAPRASVLFTVGTLAGLATGLKLTMGMYHLALAVALAPALLRLGGASWRAAAAFLGGSAAGFLPTGGVWALKLYREFGNPVFPLANGLFRSEFYEPRSFASSIYTTRGPYDLIRPLFDLALGRNERLQEIALRDLRLLLLATLALLALLAAASGRVRGRRTPQSSPPLDRTETALLIYCGFAYLSWATLVPYYRYLTPVELVAPLAVFVLVRRLLPPRLLLGAVAVVTLGLLLTTRTGSWGRRGWQEESWLKLPVPPLGLRPNSLVVMVGQPSAFAIPSFRRDARFLHLTAVDRFAAPRRWRPVIVGALAAHRGPLLLLSNFEFSRAFAEARAAEFGLRPAGRCEPIQKGPLRFRLCEMERSAGPPPGRGL